MTPKLVTKETCEATQRIFTEQYKMLDEKIETQIKDLQGYILQNEFCRRNNKKFDDYNKCMNNGKNLGVKIK